MEVLASEWTGLCSVLLKIWGGWCYSVNQHSSGMALSQSFLIHFIDFAFSMCFFSLWYHKRHNQMLWWKKQRYFVYFVPDWLGREPLHGRKSSKSFWLSLGVLVSYCHTNKLLWTRWLTTTQMYFSFSSGGQNSEMSFTDLRETKVLARLRGFGALRGNHFLAFFSL